MKKIFLLLMIIFISGCVSDKNIESSNENIEYIPTSNDKNNTEIENNFNEPAKCQGTKTIFSFPPVNLDKTSVLVPFGLMSGNHVTPIDHQYFQNFDNDKADIEVYSPGDGKITSIQHMSGSYFTNNEKVEWSDFRLVIEHTCTISSIYIHIDVLSEKITKDAPEKNGHASVDIPVKAGEIIGYYSNNIDYNLVDQEVVLPGFVVPEHYKSELWKIHVPDTFLYFDDSIKDKFIEKSFRTVEPIGGKFDHDIDGKLIGNWFEEGTNGYAGVNQENYWTTHLSISPDYIDPELIIVSMGNFDGKQEQFAVLKNSPDPSKVDVEYGLVNYKLTSFDYKNSDGTSWDRKSAAKNLKGIGYDFIQGVILLQLIENRKLKVEIFPGEENSGITEFTSNAKIYER